MPNNNNKTIDNAERKNDNMGKLMSQYPYQWVSHQSRYRKKLCESHLLPNPSPIKHHDQKYELFQTKSQMHSH